MKHPPKNLFSLTTKSKSKDNNLALSNSRLQRLKIDISEHLSQLRQGLNLHPKLIGFTLLEIAENMFALAYLGLDEQSLKEIDVLESKIRLQEWLKVLRDGTTNYQRYLSCLFEEIERVHLILADIGTNRKKLREYEILGFKLLAQEWIERIAAGDYTVYLVLINTIREQVIAYNLTLADINTTEERLEELIVFAAEKEALSWLRHLRASSNRNEYFTENLRLHVEIGGFPLKKIGTDEAEIQRLLARPLEGSKASLYRRFMENVSKNSLFSKLLSETKRSFSWTESVCIQTIFRLCAKISEWGLLPHRYE